MKHKDLVFAIVCVLWSLCILIYLLLHPCPFAWIVSLFDSDVAIYAIYNNGGWYDFGFCSGAGILFHGSRQNEGEL